MGGSAGAIRAGQVFVELFVKDEIAKGLAKAQRTLRSWGNSLSSVGTDLMMGGTAVLAPMTAAVKLFADAGHGLETLSKKTGMSVEWLSAMQYAVGQLGGEFEGFDIGIKKMQSTVADAGRGVGSSVDAIERLGLSVQQVAALSPEQQFMTIGDALNRIQDPAQRAAAAVDIFGRAGTNFLPVFSEGAAGVDKFMQRARELGVVMSRETAQKAGDLAHQMEEVWAVMKSAGNAVAEALVPTLKELGDWISRNVQAFRAWAAEHQEAIQLAFKLAAAAVVVGAAMLALGTALKVVAFAVGAVRAIVIATTAAVRGLSVAMAFASAHPVVAALTVVAGIIAAIATKFLLAKNAAKDFGNVVSDLNLFQPTDVSLPKEDMKSLQALSEKGPLDAAGVKDAKGYLAGLKTYGYDLGITIDETTGSILGMDQAWDRFAQTGADLAKLEELFQIKRTNIVSKYADERKKAERDEAKKRFEEDAQWAEDRDRQQQSEEEARAGSAMDLKKLYIDATKDGLDKELALLDVEKDAALKRAWEEGVDPKYVDAAFAIRREMAEAAAPADKPKTEALGMFSPARLEAMGIISPAQERTAKACEKISEHTKRTVEALVDMKAWNVFD